MLRGICFLNVHNINKALGTAACIYSAKHT